MYKNKYLKYKKKYLDSKLQYGGNDKWLNYAVKAFGIKMVLETLHTFFSHYNFPNITRLSIGSGNAFLEHSYKQKYPTEPDIICIDPAPMSFLNDGLAAPFIQPAYPTVVEFNAANPGAETVLLINWSGPDPDNTYDIDAIKILKPVAFFVIYAVRNYESMLSPHAGSDELVSFLDKFKKSLIVNLEGQQYMKIREWKGEGSTLRLGWYVNFTISQTHPQYFSGEVFSQSMNDYTVKLVNNPLSALSGMAALLSRPSGMAAASSSRSGFPSSSSMAAASLSRSGFPSSSSMAAAALPSRSTFTDYVRTLGPIKGLTINGSVINIDSNTPLAQKCGATIISGFENDVGFFEIALKKNRELLSEDEVIAVGMKEVSQSIEKEDLKEFLVNLVNQTF
jgi:hypothetical protein